MTRLGTASAWLSALIWLTACGRPPPIMPEPPPPTVAPPPLHSQAVTPPQASDAVELFDAVVGQIREFHEFAEPAFTALGRTWEDDVVILRAQMEQARDRTEVMRTLDALQNSLLDMHLRFVPTHATQGTLALPLSLTAETTDGQTKVVVSRVAPAVAKAIAVGDVVLAIDGTPIATLLQQHRFSASANQATPHMRRVASALARRSAALWPELSGAKASLQLQRNSDGSTFDATLPWSISQGHSDEGLDGGLSLSLQCDDTPARNYGPYTLTATGARVCVYTSKAKAFAGFPIVRHHSFMYEHEHGSGARLARLDHKVITDALAKLPRVDGVLLDLRDNHGGNNPHVFLDWYAPRSYDNLEVVVKLHDSLARRSDNRLAQLLWSGRRATRYRELAAEGKTTWAHPFLCPDDACTEGGRHTPHNRVTKAPIALLVGPQCVSSCDSLAAIFAVNHFGPLVGEPTAAAYTVYRMPLQLSDSDDRPLGTFQLALSRSRFGSDGAWVEGVPLPLDQAVPWTWSGRDSYDRDLVTAGIAALRRWKP